MTKHTPDIQSPCPKCDYEFKYYFNSVYKAAPDMLETLEYVLMLIEKKSDFNHNNARSVICGAIEKAKGE